MATAEVRRYWSRLVAGGCILHGCPAEIAHCHGGSIVERMNEPKAKGVKLPRYDWLVLPLCPLTHRVAGDSLDRNVKAWEARYGTQSSWIDYLAATHGLDLWALARMGRKSSSY